MRRPALQSRGRIDFLLSRYSIGRSTQPNALVNFGIPFPELHRARFQLARQRLDAIFRYEQRVFELRRPFPIARGRGPIVRPGDGSRGTPFTNHGFNREGMSHSHDAIRLIVGVMQDVRCRVEGRTNAVAAKIADRTESTRHHVLFNDTADFLVFPSRLHNGTRRDPTVVRRLQQVGGGSVDGATVVGDDKHFRAVSVVAVEVDGNVEVDDIADGEGTVVRDAVANHFVDGSATGFGVAMIIQWRWIRAIL